MDTKSSTGLLGTLVTVTLVGIGFGGFLTGYVLESSGDWLAPTVGVLVFAIVFVGALIAVGARSKRWRQNPYW